METKRSDLLASKKSLIWLALGIMVMSTVILAFFVMLHMGVIFLNLGMAGSSKNYFMMVLSVTAFAAGSYTYWVVHDALESEAHKSKQLHSSE